MRQIERITKEIDEVKIPLGIMPKDNRFSPKEHDQERLSAFLSDRKETATRAAYIFLKRGKNVRLADDGYFEISNPR